MDLIKRICLLAFVALMVFALSACKEDEEDTETSESMSGTIV